MNNYEADLFGSALSLPTRKTSVELAPVLFPMHEKRRFARPTYISRIPRGTDISTAVWGAEAMGLPLTPQGAELAALLNARTPAGARLYSELVALIGRRATKTTSEFAELIGRCAKYPRLRILTTAQDGTRAREILRGTVMDDLEAAGFLRRGLARFRYANGSEAIEFNNGSVIKSVPPTPSKFRSKAADVVVLDEAGEIDADLGHALIAAVLPLMDTRPDSQIIVSGTPPEEGESGFLWDELQEGLDPKVKATAVLAYMLKAGETAAVRGEDGELELDVRTIRRVHPGIGTVTTLATIRDRFDKLVSKGRLDLFEREYACKFTSTSGVGAIDLAKWLDCDSRLPVTAAVRPARVGIGYDVEPDGSAAALVLAWRDEDQVAHLELVAFRDGSDWLAGTASQAARKYRVPVGHDSIGANIDVAQVLSRLRVRTSPIQLRMMQAATARLVREIETGNLRHYAQPDLTAAVEGAVWRSVGDSGRLFGRKAASAPACPIVAAAAALWQHDQIARIQRDTPQEDQ